MTIQDGLGAEDERFELIEADATLAPAIRSLAERQRRILHLRFVEELTQSEIAAQGRRLADTGIPSVAQIDRTTTRLHERRERIRRADPPTGGRDASMRSGFQKNLASCVWGPAANLHGAIATLDLTRASPEYNLSPPRVTRRGTGAR